MKQLGCLWDGGDDHEGGDDHDGGDDHEGGDDGDKHGKNPKIKIS